MAVVEQQWHADFRKVADTGVVPTAFVVDDASEFFLIDQGAEVEEASFINYTPDVYTFKPNALGDGASGAFVFKLTSEITRAVRGGALSRKVLQNLQGRDQAYTLPTEYFVKVYVDAARNDDGEWVVQNDRPWREVYTQAVMTKAMHFEKMNNATGFCTQYDAGLVDSSKVMKLLFSSEMLRVFELPVIDFPDKLLVTLFSEAPGVPLSAVTPYNCERTSDNSKKETIRLAMNNLFGAAVQTWATFEMMRRHLGDADHPACHWDLHPDNIFVNSNRQRPGKINAGVLNLKAKCAWALRRLSNQKNQYAASKAYLIRVKSAPSMYSQADLVSAFKQDGLDAQSGFVRDIVKYLGGSTDSDPLISASNLRATLIDFDLVSGSVFSKRLPNHSGKLAALSRGARTGTFYQRARWAVQQSAVKMLLPPADVVSSAAILTERTLNWLATWVGMPATTQAMLILTREMVPLYVTYSGELGTVAKVGDSAYDDCHIACYLAMGATASLSKVACPHVAFEQLFLYTLHDVVKLVARAPGRVIAQIASQWLAGKAEQLMYSMYPAPIIAAQHTLLDSIWLPLADPLCNVLLSLNVPKDIYLRLSRRLMCAISTLDGIVSAKYGHKGYPVHMGLDSLGIQARVPVPQAYVAVRGSHPIVAFLKGTTTTNYAGLQFSPGQCSFTMSYKNKRPKIEIRVPDFTIALINDIPADSTDIIASTTPNSTYYVRQGVMDPRWWSNPVQVADVRASVDAGEAFGTTKIRLSMNLDKDSVPSLLEQAMGLVLAPSDAPLQAKTAQIVLRMLMGVLKLGVPPLLQWLATIEKQVTDKLTAWVTQSETGYKVELLMITPPSLNNVAPCVPNQQPASGHGWLNDFLDCAVQEPQSSQPFINVETLVQSWKTWPTLNVDLIYGEESTLLTSFKAADYAMENTKDYKMFGGRNVEVVSLDYSAQGRLVQSATVVLPAQNKDFNAIKIEFPSSVKRFYGCHWTVKNLQTSVQTGAISTVGKQRTVFIWLTRPLTTLLKKKRSRSTDVVLQLTNFVNERPAPDLLRGVANAVMNAAFPENMGSTPLVRNTANEGCTLFMFPRENVSETIKTNKSARTASMQCAARELAQFQASNVGLSVPKLTYFKGSQQGEKLTAFYKTLLREYLDTAISETPPYMWESFATNLLAGVTSGGVVQAQTKALLEALFNSNLTAGEVYALAVAALPGSSVPSQGNNLLQGQLLAVSWHRIPVLSERVQQLHALWKALDAATRQRVTAYVNSIRLAATTSLSTKLQQLWGSPLLQDCVQLLIDKQTEAETSSALNAQNKREGSSIKKMLSYLIAVRDLHVTEDEQIEFKDMLTASLDSAFSKPVTFWDLSTSGRLPPEMQLTSLSGIRSIANAVLPQPLLQSI